MSSDLPPNPYGSSSTPMSPMSGLGPNVPNYLVQSILVTLCCCIPFGIVAIIYAAQVNTKLAANDFAGAQQSSNNAKKWCLIGLVTGIVVNIIALAVQMVVTTAAVQQQGGMPGM